MVEILIIVFILFPAIVLHEYAHGWVAYRLGDPTAKQAGRLTLNPLKHVDPVGTILVPGLLIGLRAMGVPIFPVGWAKPVPVNFMRLRAPKRDMVLVGLAGPTVNILIAVAFSQILRWTTPTTLAEQAVALVVFVNLLLAIFNMLPVPPLDGSRLVMGLLPNPYLRHYVRLEPYGLLIVIVLLNLGVFEKVVLPLVTLCSHYLGVSLP